MNFLSLFVLIPLLMLLGLWLSRNIAQIRAVMVTGASALLVLSAALTVMYLNARHAGAGLEFRQLPGVKIWKNQEYGFLSEILWNLY